MLQTKDFYYDLPETSIAQTPLKDRDASKLMVLDRTNHSIKHTVFNNIVQWLSPGDCLVLNNTRVLPARVYGTKQTGAKVEFLLLSHLGDNCWESLVKPGRRAKVGDVFNFADGEMTGEIVNIIDAGIRIVQFSDVDDIEAVLRRVGTMPLPPYITETLTEQERYQTVFNRITGSAAAPTAGLHFTHSLLKQIEDMGVTIAYVTLHVGLGTFRPVKVDVIEAHKMHAEWYALDQKNATIINEAKSRGGRIFSVGTTSTRTLESIFQKYGRVKAAKGWTDIFIYPGFTFKVTDGLITNFHLPESTLLMLVSAFYDRTQILNAYDVALKQDYRFFSFGDAMLIM